MTQSPDAVYQQRLASYQQRLASLQSSVTYFASIPETDLGRPVPTCPGWTVRSVISHLAYQAGIGWTALMRAEPGQAASAATEAIRAAPAGRGVELFDEVMTLLVDAVASAAPDDACNTFFGSGTYAYWALHASSEVLLHHVDVQYARGETPGLSWSQGSDGLEWSALVLPVMAATAPEPAPGSLDVLPTEGTPIRLGPDEATASITGTASDLFLHLWGRHPGRLQTDGDHGVATWWTQVSGRTFQHPALG